MPTYTTNAYLTVDEFLARFDRRVEMQLSGDENSRQGNLTNLGIIIDDAASEFDSYIDGRYTLGTVYAANPMPFVIKRAVAIMASRNNWIRRELSPKDFERALEWLDKWLEQIRLGEINLPTINRANTAGPILIDSYHPDGDSTFNGTFGWQDPPSGPFKSWGGGCGWW